MEYFPGGDLDDWMLTNDKIDPELSRLWLFQLVSALRHLKKLGYAHGDVKPKNVLVVGERLLKLCDFGCMKPLNEGLSTSFCGSFGYVAPEIYRKEPHDPEKADVWSYGEVWETCNCNPETSLSMILFFNWQSSNLTRDTHPITFCLIYVTSNMTVAIKIFFVARGNCVQTGDTWPDNLHVQ